LSPDNFMRFLKLCADRGVSDILVQGGDYIWVELHGRQLKASTTTIKQGQLSPLMASAWSAEIESMIKQGDEGVDRALELAGEEFGLARGTTLRFRTNFVQARIASIDEAYSITMRVIPSDLPDIDKMGIEPDLIRGCYAEMGLVLVCGPTGSGKTTFLAGLYKKAGAEMPDRKVITYEDPIEYVLMRRKPSIIGIGEARDRETIEAMTEAGLTGHLCFATMHTESVAETINRAIQTYPPDQQAGMASRLAGALRVILVQRLLKTTDGKRAAIREYLVFDREVRNELQSLPYTDWGRFIRGLLEKAEATLDDKAWRLFQADRIDAGEFISLAGAKEFKKRWELEGLNHGI